MVRALERGLSLGDFEILTVGGIVDFIVTYDNEHLTEDEKKPEVKQASQEDFDRF